MGIKLRLSCIWMLTVLILGPQSSHALTLPYFSFDIPSQRVSQFMRGGLNLEYAWTASYDIGFTQGSGYSITQTIRLTGFDPDQAVKDLWETSTESIWTTQDRFNVPIVVDLQFVQSGAHHVVNVIEGSGGRGNMLRWFSGWPAGSGSPVPWAHEVGHMFGLFDEYQGGAVNPDGSFGSVPGSLMGGGGQAMYDRYYQFVADWAAIQERPAAVGLPESATFVFMASGLCALIWFNERRKQSGSRQARLVAEYDHRIVR